MNASFREEAKLYLINFEGMFEEFLWASQYALMPAIEVFRIPPSIRPFVPGG
jgi:hypothetical protein